MYIKQFDDQGQYVSDYTEITKDVVNLGVLSQQLDNADYDIGVFRNSGITLKMRNDEGKYGEADSLRSIFKYKRSDSIIKITWDFRDYDLICGFCYAGDEPLCGPVDVFYGLLTEVSSSSNIQAQDIDFQILGPELLFERAIVPIDDISDGDMISDIIYTILNQSKINVLLNISPSNISVGIDTAIDSKAGLENKTVKAALDDLLNVSNSVLRLEDFTVHISNRDPSDYDMYAFFGQASDIGTENVIDVREFRDGLNRTFNYWTWDDTTLFSQDEYSIEKYGVISNNLKTDLIDVASTSKIQNILNANRDDFSFPKTEFKLDTPINYDTLALTLLDKVSIDYPTVYVPADSNPLPRYGIDVYEDPVYPFEQWSLKISNLDRFKIISKKIDMNKSVITFGLREV